MSQSSRSQYRVIVEKDVPSPPRDGINLMADIYCPRRQTAEQTVFHDARYPSHVLLPMMPR